MAPSRLSLLPPPASTVGRCFRTTGDGRIPITRNWSALLEAAQRLGPVALETRHAYARLVVAQPLPPLLWQVGRHQACSEDGALHFHFAHWHEAWGRLSPCDCCGSPGRVEVRNTYDLDFLQVCAPCASPVADWSDFLATVALDPAREPTTPAVPPMFPRLPMDTPWLSGDAETLLILLAALGHENVPVSWRLRSAEVSHTREFAIQNLDEGGGIVSASAGTTIAQCNLKVLRTFAVNTRAASWPLHVIGPDRIVLFTLAAAADPQAAASWRSALQAVFPELI